MAKFVITAAFTVLAVAFANPSIVQTLTEENFDEATKSGNWIIKFYAVLCFYVFDVSHVFQPWCGHCKHVAPLFEAAARQSFQYMQFGNIDATLEHGLKKRFEIEGYPTILFRRKGATIMIFTLYRFVTVLIRGEISKV
jgi:thiol-disulfide isomerase/thioredoxin